MSKELRIMELVSYVTTLTRTSLSHDELICLQELATPRKDELPPAAVNPTLVDSLVNSLMNNERINSIKDYRALTGVGLREAKDAIERLWPLNTENIRQPTDI